MYHIERHVAEQAQRHGTLGMFGQEGDEAVHPAGRKPRAAGTAGERAAGASTGFVNQMVLAGSAKPAVLVTGVEVSTFRM